MISLVAVSGCFESLGVVTLATDTETGGDTAPGPGSPPSSSSGNETSAEETSTSGTQDPTVADATSRSDETGSDASATQCMEFCAKEDVQILGGANYIAA